MKQINLQKSSFIVEETKQSSSVIATDESKMFVVFLNFYKQIFYYNIITL